MDITVPDFSDRSDRGQVGIETLIVFIAMILVAAIAASVLINTAGYLQNQASATSEDSESQVSNQVLVVSTIGEINEGATRNNISEINMTVMQSPGAGEIDLEGASVEYIGPDGEETLVYNGNTTSLSPGEFYVAGVKDDGNTAPVLTDRGDRFVIQVPLSSDSTSDIRYLEAGEEATLRIVTQSGSQAVTVVNAPESLSSYKDGDAVEL